MHELLADVVTPPIHTDLTTEDDTPVDNLFSEKQQRLLTESLYNSWRGPGAGRPFLAAANVGIFYAVHRPPLVPDVFLSLDVEMPDDWWQTGGRSYLVWEVGKPPEVAIEIVSNTKGEERGRKLSEYAHLRVAYYVVYDPGGQVQPAPLAVFQLQGADFREVETAWLPAVQLGLTVWDGEYEGRRARWLRWQREDGTLVLTGHERAERLATQLRSLGVEPNE